MAKKSLYYFALFVNTRSKISEFSVSVGNFNISYSSYGLFSDDLEPIFLQIDDLDYSIPDTVVGNLTAVSTYFLSKVCNIATSLASKAIEQNTELNLQGAENYIPRIF